MEMGLPNSTPDKATFRWTAVKTYEPEDPQYEPYDWSQAPETNVKPPDVQIPVAVEFGARPAGSLDTTIGQFDVARAIITVMDTDYPSVATADQVILGENTYIIDLWAPPVGLFVVTIYTCYASAIDES